MNNKKQRNRLFTMLLLVMAILMPYEGAWAQTEPSKPSIGNGVDNPFQISTAAELAWFRDYVNGTIVDEGEADGTTHLSASAMLTADIDLSEFCYAADDSKNIIAKSWEPIGVGDAYTGTFDGSGKTISNLYIKAEKNQAGLFGYTFQSTIKNLTFENANVTNTELYTGILVGDAGYQTTLQNIKISTNKCQVIGGKDYTGGIAGSLDGNAYNCVNYAMVQGQEDVGGLFGYYSREGNSITACANYGKVTAARKNAGGLVGYFDSGTIQDCANYGDITGTNAVGNLIGSADKCNLNNVLGTGNVTATSSPSFSKRGGLLAGYINDSSSTASGILAYNSCAKLTINGTEQTGDAVKTIGEGSLTSAEKIKAFTTEQLKSGLIANLLQKNASESAKWGQNLANDGDNYPVIGSEHTVYATEDLLVNCKTNEVLTGSFTNNPTSSAIRYQHGTTIRHAATDATCTETATKEYWQCQDCLRTYSDSQLTEELTDVTIAEKPALGHKNDEDGYCNQCQHYVAVKPSKENGVYLIAKPCHLAWFRDYVNGTIVDEGEVAGTTHPSASAMLTADIDLKNYCHAAEGGKELLSWIPIGSEKNRWKGNMDGQGHTISHFYIKTAQDYVGLFGYTDGATIQDLIFDYAKVENVNTTGTKTNYTGILAGKAYGDSPSHIKGIKTTNNCTVIGQKDTGGIVGCAKINLENCENRSSVKGTGNVGGIAGSSFERNIKRCTNYGTVENGRNQYIGGIIGYAYGISIEDCANYGNITSAGPVAGGIAGSTMDNNSIQNVFSYGDVTYTNTSGIIIGLVGGTLTAKGIVAYNKEALLNNSSENIKIVGAGSLTLEDGKVEADVVKAFTKQQIKSGEVAWLLNGSTSVPTEGSTLAWYQKLGENGDEYPVLTPKDGNTVYYSDCTCVDKQVKIYSNMENEKFDKHAKGTETLLTNGLYSSTCQRCQANFMYIKDFCGIDGNDLELTANTDGSYTAVKPVDINDNAVYDSPVDFTAPTLNYIRSFAHDKWQALYVPFETEVTEELLKDFELAAPNNLHEYELADGKTKISLEAKLMKSGYTIKAQRPYLIRAKEAGEKIIQLADCPLKGAAEDSYVDCSSVLRHYKFIGTLKGKTNFDTTADFVLQQGLFRGTETDTQLKPMRWYLNATDRNTDMGILPGSGNNGDGSGADGGNGSTQASRSINITIVDGDATTGIDELHVITEQTSGSKNGARLGIYDLQGRKLSQEPQNGVYIKDGKKVIK
mgnify:FL=1